MNAFWKLFPFRSKHIQLAERKQKAFGKAAGNGGGGDDAFTETWERVQSALVKAARSLGASFPNLQFGDGYFQYCELILICK